MRVLLVSANTERINMVTVPLGLGLVAAATRRAEHDVRFLDLLGKSDPAVAAREAVLDFKPDVVGISVRNIDDQNAQAPRFLLEPARGVVQACQAACSAPVVVGGAGFSLFPREALAFLGADYGVAGDGELAFPALLEHLGRGGGTRADIPGVWSRDAAPSIARAHDVELAACSGWDEVLDDIARGPDLWVPVQGRRGCPNDCSYCSTSLVQGRRIRTRPPAEVAATVERLVRQGAKRFYFVDNSFNIPEAWALELCALLQKMQPRPEWRCILYPERVRPELVDAMASAGCVEVSLGFESGDDAILRSMNKRFTTRDVRETSELLHSRGIRRMGFLLFGGPGETRGSVERSLAFARDLKLEGLKTTVGIRIYPGTALARTALAEGIIASGDDLLQPKFYLAPGLEPWIHQRLAAQA